MSPYTVMWPRLDFSGRLTRNETTSANYDDGQQARSAYSVKCLSSPSVDLWRGNECLRITRHGEEYVYINE